MRGWYVHWTVAEELQTLLRPVILYMDAIYYPDAATEWRTAFHQLVETWKSQHTPEKMDADPVFQAVRQMFKAIRLDPARYRPSSEALIRRVFREGSLPFIHPVVALNNIVSLYFRLPMGCYDPDEIGPHVTFRLGRAGESFESLRHQPFRAEGRIVIADNGPFGSPIVDSLRTMLKPHSQRCLLVWYAPTPVDPAHVEAAVRWLLQLNHAYTVARPARIWRYDPDTHTFHAESPHGPT